MPPLPEKLGLAPLLPNPAPQADLSHVSVPYHLSRVLMTYFPKALAGGELALDLGCGEALHREACEAAGFEYVGLDYESGKSQLLGDAHALPFEVGSFGFVLSVAVLEHLRFPVIAMREVHRVLKPNGLLVGTVAFLEPFHSESFYHHTHLGLCNTLREGGFEIERIGPSASWTGLAAQAQMGLFPRMPAGLARALFLPHQLLHRLWWRIGRIVDPRATEELRLLSNSGAFAFVARKQA